MTEKVKKPRKKKAKKEETTEQEQSELTPKEQAEMLRNYVASMQKVQGYSDEDVMNIIDSVYRRFLLVLNYSPLSKDPAMKSMKLELKTIFEDEKQRYEPKKENQEE